MFPSRTSHLILVAALLRGGVAVAQSFEVASIKPNAANDFRVSIQFAPGGRFVATGINTRILLSQAFEVKDFQIINAPSWAGDSRFDVNAKAEGSAERIAPDKLRPMLKSLLEERFGLKYHQETKEMPVYHLVVAKSGAKLTPSPDAPAGGERRPQMVRMGRGQLNADGIGMAAFARMLSQNLGREVVDQTGLTGNYAVKLEWTPEPGQGGGFGIPLPPGALPSVDPNGPTLTTALQEQLGLRLESAKAPVSVIVIDSLTKPTEN